MKLFSYLAFLCFLEISVAFVVEVVLDPKSPLNRAGAFSCLFYCFWSFCMIFVYGASPPVALAFSHLYYLGSLFVTPALLWFYLTIAGSKLRTKLLFCVPAAIFSAFVYGDFLRNGFYYVAFLPGPWGNMGVPGPNQFWANITPLISFLEIIISLIVLIRARMRSDSRRLSRQIDTLVVSVLITFVLYFLGWYVELHFGLPNTMVLSGLYLVTATFVMMFRFRFLQKDFPLLEHHSADVVQDAALLVDDRRRILGANPAAITRFERTESELVGRDFATFVKSPTMILREWNLAISSEPLHRWVPCETVGRSTFLSLTPRYDSFGDFAGAVVLIGDLQNFDTSARLMGLTDREKEIVLLMMQGIDTNECGDILLIAPGTVKRHIHNVYEKSGVANAVQLFNRLLSE